MSYNIAIVGSTGAVGREMLETLSYRKFPCKNVYALASKSSLGKEVSFGEDKVLKVQALEDFDFSKADIALFSAGSDVSKKFAPIAGKNKCIVIDNSSFFRMDKDVPLIVPEVNPHHVSDFKKKNIIANPNCSTIQMVTALSPLHKEFTIKKVFVSTYQAVSGAGKEAMYELLSQTKDYFDNKEMNSKNFTKQIAFNAIPHIDSFLDNGTTKEEQKNHDEVKKILDKKINITSTCVRIPVLVSHSISINVEFNKKYNLDEIRNVLSSSPGCKVVDEKKDGGYITPVEAENKYETFISRIREDNSQSNTINMWIVSDNLLKGAALNAVEIAETLIKENLYEK